MVLMIDLLFFDGTVPALMRGDFCCQRMFIDISSKVCYPMWVLLMDL